MSTDNSIQVTIHPIQGTTKDLMIIYNAPSCFKHESQKKEKKQPLSRKNHVNRLKRLPSRIWRDT